MGTFHAMTSELRKKFYNLVASCGSEDVLIEFINSSLRKLNRFDIRVPEVILDLTLASIDHSEGLVDFGQHKSTENLSLAKERIVTESYDADDEGLDDLFIFPCHAMFEDCHPELLLHYHGEHLMMAKNSTRIIKHPKLCKFVVDYMFENLRILVNGRNGLPRKLNEHSRDPTIDSLADSLFEHLEVRSGSIDDSYNDHDDDEEEEDDLMVHRKTVAYLSSVIGIIKKLEKVCSMEYNNCRILSRIDTIDSVMRTLHFLIETLADKQDIFLEALLKFAFTLANYKIIGRDLKQIFLLIKNDNTDLQIVLHCLEKLLNQHHKLLKNIQPLKSIKFPIASKTAEEMKPNSYVSKSWHGTLRSSVIRYKRSQSRLHDYKFPLFGNLSSEDIELREPTANNICDSTQSKHLTPSWLESSFMLPISNTSLFHNSEINFCCSMWISVCGDLLIVENTRAKSKSKVSSPKEERVPIFADWRYLKGHWVRLTSRKKLARIYRRKRKFRKSTEEPERSYSVSGSTESSDHDEDEGVKTDSRKNDRLKPKPRNKPKNGYSAFASTNSINNRVLYQSSSKLSPNRKAFLGKLHRNEMRSNSNNPGKPTRDNTQEFLIHLISFALDRLTIEVWLNIKHMNFCIRICRLSDNGQTSLLVETTLPSHLHANGSWSHLMFCIREISRNSIDSGLNFKVTIDGVHRESESLIYPKFMRDSAFRNFACLIGCERSSFGYVWKLSQVNIYENSPSEDLAIFIAGKGPDFLNFTDLGHRSTLTLPDITQRSIKNLLKPRNLSIYNAIDEERSINWCHQNLVMSYAAHNTDHFLDYSIGSKSSNNPSERFIQAKILNFARSLKCTVNYGFGSALVDAGGVESVLLCFADIIRRTHESDSTTHALAVSILFKMNQTNQYHLNRFLDELNGLKLVEFILAHPSCVVSKQMLYYYVDLCLMKEGEFSIIKSPKLFYHLLSSWRAWHKDTGIAKLLYKKLIRILKPKNTFHTGDDDNGNIKTEGRKLESFYLSHNYRMMFNAGGIDILMSILRECLVPLDDNDLKINQDLVVLIVNLISLLIKHPPGLDVILDIMEFLMFLHPDTKACVESLEEKSSYLHLLQADNEGTVIYDDEDDDSLSISRHEIHAGNLNTPVTPPSSFKSSTESVSEETRINGKRSFLSSSFKSGDQFTRGDSSLDLARFINQQQDSMENDYLDPNFPWPKYKSRHETRTNHQHELNEEDSGKDDDIRNFTIAYITDMLASIIKLILYDPAKILSEAIQKSILDARKIVVLANNDSSSVREKVFRLFLYCIRACYNLNLKSVQARYEQVDSNHPSFKICLPIQLMARQLVQYPTTNKMIRLCYGIIVGIDDFETVDEVCALFDIDTSDNNLQLNTMILLIQIITKLTEPRYIVSTLIFIHAYIRQCAHIRGGHEIIDILIQNNLMDSLMRLYFAYLKYKTCATINNEYKDGRESRDFDLALDELDRTLVLISQYLLNNPSTSEAIEPIKDILLNLDLLNSYVPSKFKHILRTRKVKILGAALASCREYEKSSRREELGYLRNLMVVLLENRKAPDTGEMFMQNGLGNNHHPRVDIHDRINEYKYDGINGEDSMRMNTMISTTSDKKITKANVIDRFRITLDMIVDFIVSREAEVDTSPYERDFIIRMVETIMSYLDEYNQEIFSFGKKGNSWLLILSKLVPIMRESFTKLITYLLSPSDSMNLDDRKYYASKILDILDNDTQKLVRLLRIDHFNSTTSNITFRILDVFVRDLIHLDNSANPNESFDDENLMEDGRRKLQDLAKRIQNELVQMDTKSAHSFESSYLGSYNKMFNQDLDNEFRNYWKSELNKIREDNREKCDSLKLGSANLSQLVDPQEFSHRIMDESLKITREVVNIKNEQRKAYLDDLKQTKVYDYHVRQNWLSLIIGNTHERAIWFMENHYPKSWELNPVEGPSRIRRRLRPCKLTLDSRFIRYDQKRSMKRESDSPISPSNKSLSGFQKNLADDWFNQYSPHPLCSIVFSRDGFMNSNDLRLRMFTTDKIYFNCDCNIIRPNEVCKGEISIATWCIHFIGEPGENLNDKFRNPAFLRLGSHIDNYMIKTASPGLSSATARGSQSNQSAILSDQKTTSNISETMTNTTSATRRRTFINTIAIDFWFDEIIEIWDRRYQLQDVGLEIFLTNNMTHLIGFQSKKDREEFKQNLFKEQHKMINLQRFNAHTSLNKLTQLWKDGRLTNFDYLTCLNKLAGRSFNDLMQYPIFPFVLSNYRSKVLDLNSSSSFRNLRKPMAVQRSEKESIFINNYNDCRTSNLAIGVSSMARPYHYGNHYSNSATILHFLVRLPPFTQMLIQYQDNNFDQPDRTFHSVENTWNLITRDSNTDFKELIPEFFFLPEMFINYERLELGRKQNGELVDDVKLPPWCPNSDARLFTLIHRQALESINVSENLNHWIDLVFGFKQTGKGAVEALNVFHPITYYGMINLNEPANQSTTTQPNSGNNSSNNSNIIYSTPLSSTLGLIAPKSSSVSSDYLSTVINNFNNNHHSTSTFNSISDSSSSRGNKEFEHQQANIERLALETMIKTYGQMPRQLFTTPSKPRALFGFSLQPTTVTADAIKTSPTISSKTSTGPKKYVADALSINQVSSSSQKYNSNIMKKFELLGQVKGLRWGDYMGSPEGSEIIVVKQKSIKFDGVKSAMKSRANENHPVTKFNLCLLPNGEIAILRSNRSFMLNYKTDKKSCIDYKLSFPSVRFSRRTGISNSAKLNLFSNMVIGRQDINYIEPVHLSASQYDSINPSASYLMPLSSCKSKYSLDSLSLVSWSYLDGAIKIRYPAMNHQKSSIPLAHVNSFVDTITTCVSVPELNLLLVGFRSGSICAHIVSSSHDTKYIDQYIPPAAPAIPSIATASSVSANYNSTPILRDNDSISSDYFYNNYSDRSTVSSSAATTPSILDASISPVTFLSSSRLSSNTTDESNNSNPLSGKMVRSFRSINKNTRWLHCHNKSIVCMKINVTFGIVVTGSNDGTSVIWDLSSLTYVRTINYKQEMKPIDHQLSPSSSFESEKQRYHQQQQNSEFLCDCERRISVDHEGNNLVDSSTRTNNRKFYPGLKTVGNENCVCKIGVDLISISDTLGDIVTVKNIHDRVFCNEENDDLAVRRESSDHLSTTTSSSCVGKGSNLTSILYVHTINGSLVGLVNCQTHVTSVCYSNAPEGISVNVIVVGLVNGVVRLYSSWDLTHVREFHITGLSLPVTSLLYSRDNQLLYLGFEDGQLIVLSNRNKREKRPISLPKEWIL